MNEAEKTKAIERFSWSLNTLLTDMRDSALKQFKYNLDVNVPNGMKPELAPQHAITSALVLNANKRTGWDSEAAINLAALIVEDVNLHDLARAIRKAEL